MSKAEETQKGKYNFVTKLFKLVSHDFRDNTVISPKLIQMSIAIVLFATTDETATKIRNHLHLKFKNNFDVAKSFHDLFANPRIGPILNFSLNVFPNIQYDFLESYKEVVKIALHVLPEFVDFEQSAVAAEHINCWARYVTKNRIKKIVKPCFFQKETSLVLVGTSQFKAFWRKPFDPTSTKYGRFYIDEFRSVPVEMMTAYEEYRVADIADLDATAVELEFSCSDISMIIFLPNSKVGLRKMNRNLARNDVFDLCERLFPQTILLEMPKFITEFQIELTSYIQQLGLSSIFSDRAMFDYLLKNNRQVNVSNIFHKVVISINESGSEVDVPETPEKLKLCTKESKKYPDHPKKVMTVNKPFSYVIKDKYEIYFMGYVVLPLKNYRCTNYLRK